MHWDGAVSIGTILALATTLGAIFLAFNRFVSKHNQSSVILTNAMNNLAAVTDKLQKSVETQNGRLTSVENQLAIRVEVERRLALLTQGHGK